MVGSQREGPPPQGCSSPMIMTAVPASMAKSVKNMIWYESRKCWKRLVPSAPNMNTAVTTEGTVGQKLTPSGSDPLHR